MNDLLVSAIRRIRGRHFSIAEEVTGKVLLLEIFYRLPSLTRGILHSVRPGVMPHFRESDVRVQFPAYLNIGKGAVIERGAALRCLSRRGFEIGENVTIGKFASIECSGSLRRLGVGFRIGDRSSVGDYSVIGTAGGVSIGSDVMMGPRVAIHAQNHVADTTTLPMQQQGTTERGVTIEDDCWIGSGSTILDGVTIGRGSIVAAGSVVNRDVPSWSIVGGSPARLIRRRED